MDGVFVTNRSSWSTLSHTWGFGLAEEGMLQYIFRINLHDTQSRK